MSTDDIKTRSKIALDEMFDNQSVGNPDGQTSGHMDVKEDVKKVGQSTGSKSIQTSNHSYGNTFSQPDEKLTCKITFNTSESRLLAFNTLYANKIINNKKKDKSALLNEALDLLIERYKDEF